MPERDGYPAGVPCWIDTSQPAPQAAADFYSGLFGWDVENVMPEGSGGVYLIGRIRGGDVAAISARQPGDNASPAWNTYICVDSVDETAANVNDAGGRLVVEPMDVMDAGRMAVAVDTEGAVFNLWQPGQHKGAKVVNEHGSLNFNTLSTRNPDQAKAFYRAVFGWETLNLGGGAEMWTLPGYGDHLEELNPGMRAGMAEMGAPKGFEDVVAALMPLGDDQPGTPAHWSVTFAVDDADASAARAGELGGRALVPPFDAPWVRTAVIADPAGATFIASQFVAENKDLGATADAGAA